MNMHLQNEVKLRQRLQVPWIVWQRAVCNNWKKVAWPKLKMNMKMIWLENSPASNLKRNQHLEHLKKDLITKVLTTSYPIPKVRDKSMMELMIMLMILEEAPAAESKMMLFKVMKVLQLRVLNLFKMMCMRRTWLFHFQISNNKNQLSRTLESQNNTLMTWRKMSQTITNFDIQ